MKLYGFPPSPNTFKVQALAAHLQIPLELELVDLSKGEQRNDQFLLLNPTGRTPVLVDGDFTLSESNAILQYVAAKKNTTVWPEDARSRADIARWQFWQASHWHQGCGGFLWEKLVKKVLLHMEPDSAALRQAEEAFHRDAPVLDRHLSSRQYLVNDTLTLADFSVAAYLHYAADVELPLETYQHIRAWYERVASWPAWRSSMPKR